MTQGLMVMDNIEFETRYAAINRKYDADIVQLNKARTQELRELEELFRISNEHTQRLRAAQNAGN